MEFFLLFYVFSMLFALNQHRSEIRLAFGCAIKAPNVRVRHAEVVGFFDTLSGGHSVPQHPHDKGFQPLTLFGMLRVCII